MSVTKAQSEPSSLSGEMWVYASSLAGLPDFFEAVNAEPEIVARPLSERVLSSAMMTVFGLTAAAASPFVFAAATVVGAGEKIWGSIDILPEVAEKVRLFGNALQEQQQMLASLEPILELSKKVSVTTQGVEKRAQHAEAAAQTLEELRATYAAETPVLEQLSTFTSRLEKTLPQLIGPSTSLKGMLLQENVEVLTKLSSQQQRLRELKNRLQQVVSKVQRQAIDLQKCEEGIAILTRLKGHQIEGLEGIDPPPPRFNNVVLGSQTLVE